MNTKADVLLPRPLLASKKTRLNPQTTECTLCIKASDSKIFRDEMFT